MYPTGSPAGGRSCERGQFYLRAWRRRGFHEQVHRNECKMAKQLGVQEDDWTQGYRNQQQERKRRPSSNFNDLKLCNYKLVPCPEMITTNKNYKTKKVSRIFDTLKISKSLKLKRCENFLPSKLNLN